MPMPNNVTSALDRLKIDLRTSPIFDATWYRTAYGDLDPATDPAEHFLNIGLAQGRSPNAFMDVAWYADRYSDVRETRADPFLHYVEYGWREGRDPGPWFSTERYLATNPGARTAHMDPLIHFLQAKAVEGGSPLNLDAAEMWIRGRDLGSAMVCQWAGEMVLHGVRVRTRITDSWAAFHRATSSMRTRLAIRWGKPCRTRLVSVNGAALTPAVAKAAGRNLIVLFDDVAAARSVRPELQDALSRATVATTSPRIAQVLAGIPGSAVSLYREPMSGAYLRKSLPERTMDIVWRCPSPRASRGKPTPQMKERLAIAARLAPFGLVIVGDRGWQGRHVPPGRLDLRDNWGTQSCAQDCYGAAKLSLVTPPWGRDGEVTADILIALASGTLPIVPVSMLPALCARFGDDFPIALYRDVDEITAIVAHFLAHEDERAALVGKVRKSLLAEPGYSTLVGEVIGKVTTNG